MAFIPHVHRVYGTTATGGETVEDETREGEGMHAAAAALSPELSSPTAAGDVATQWREDECFPDIDGFKVSVSDSLDEALMKLEAIPPAAFDHVFVGVFDFEALVEAGFHPKLDLEKCVKLVVNALKGDTSTTVKFTVVGYDIELNIKAPATFFEAKLKLTREQVDATTRKLRKTLAAVAVSERQLGEALADLVAATADGDAAKQQLVEAKGQLEAVTLRMTELSKEMTILKSAMDKIKVESGAQIEEAIAGRRTAEQTMAEVKAESERLSVKLKAAVSQAATERRTAEQMLDEVKAESERRSVDLKAAMAECRSVKQQLAKEKSLAATERRTAEQKLDEVKAESDCRRRKVAMSLTSDSGSIIEELREANAKAMADCRALEQRLAKEKSLAAAERRTAERKLAEAKAESDRRSVELKSAMAECRTAERKLAEANAESECRSGELKAAMSAASVSGTTFKKLREANAKAIAECRSLEQRLAKEKLHTAAELRVKQKLMESKAESERLNAKLKAELTSTLCKCRTVEQKLVDAKAQSAAERRSIAKPKPTRVRGKSELKKSTTTTASDSGAISSAACIKPSEFFISETPVRGHRWSEWKPKAKTQLMSASSDSSSATAESFPKPTADKKPSLDCTSLCFDTVKKKGKTNPKSFVVCEDGKCATARWEAQIILTPAVSSDSQVTFLVASNPKPCDSVGITDDYTKSLAKCGCSFSWMGYALVNGSGVAGGHGFDRWKKGERLKLCWNQSRGILTVVTSKGEFVFPKWTSRSSSIWFAVNSGKHTKLRIE